MSQLYRCDKCGETFEGVSEGVYIEMPTVSGRRVHSLDLCPGCLELFKKFINFPTA